MSSQLSSLSELDSNCDKYCVFECGSQVFAILATSIREVSLKPNVASVPGSHPALAGIGRFRNEFVPLMRIVDDAIAPTASRESQVVVIASDHGSWGLLVDRVVGLAGLELALGSEPHGGEGWMAAVMGAATLEGRVVKVLDERSLYRYSANLLNQFWAPATAG